MTIYFFKILKNTFRAIINKIQDVRMAESAAALAYYLTLATFPALISLVAILAYLPIPGLENNIVNTISSTVPGNSGEVLINILKEVISEKKPSILSFGFLAALWFSSSGMEALINQLNHSFKVKEVRSFARRRLVAIGLTLIYVFALILVTVVTVLGKKLNFFVHDLFGFSYMAKTTFFLIKYVIGFSFLLLLFSSVYYLAPSQKQEFKFISIGSCFSSIALVLAAIGFNFYISNLASYNQIYGSIGGVIIYMLWLYITGFILLFGAEINAFLNPCPD